MLQCDPRSQMMVVIPFFFWFLILLSVYFHMFEEQRQELCPALKTRGGVCRNQSAI